MISAVHTSGNTLGYQAPGVGRDPSQSPRIWDHLQVNQLRSTQHTSPTIWYYKNWIGWTRTGDFFHGYPFVHQATYGELVRLDLPRCPPTILVFSPELAEQVRIDSLKSKISWLRRCTGRREVTHTGQVKKTNNIELIFLWKSYKGSLHSPIMQFF